MQRSSMALDFSCLILEVKTGQKAGLMASLRGTFGECKKSSKYRRNRRQWIKWWFIYTYAYHEPEPEISHPGVTQVFWGFETVKLLQQNFSHENMSSRKKDFSCVT